MTTHLTWTEDGWDYDYPPRYAFAEFWLAVALCAAREMGRRDALLATDRGPDWSAPKYRDTPLDRDWRY